jgi:hypothetical protein
MKKKVFIASIFCFIVLLLSSCNSKKGDGDNQAETPEGVVVGGMEGAEGIFDQTEDDYSLKLQRGTYDGFSWTWTDTETLSVSPILPGDSAFFRIAIMTSKNINLKMNFSGFYSYVGDYIGVSNKYVTFGGLKKYDIVNNKVQVTEGGSAKTLYNISGSTVSLADYKVEDVFRFYDYGICNTNDDSIVSGKPGIKVYYDNVPLDNNVLGDGITPSTLDNASANYNVRLWGDQNVAFAYFALELNIAAVRTNYSYTLDGETITCFDSNLYTAQYLNIKRINIEEVNN